MKDLIIIGASGFGREVSWLVERINSINPTWNLLGFLDDNLDIQNKIINGYNVLGTLKTINKYIDAYFVCAIGSSKVRKNIIKKIGNIKYATLIDPTVIVSNSVSIGEGSIVCAKSICTVNINIGKYVTINLDCTIGHDAVIGDFVTLYPNVNVSGSTCLCECVEIGTGTQIIQGKKIGKNTIVGAGSVVIKDLPENCTAVGVPAKVIKVNEE